MEKVRVFKSQLKNLLLINLIIGLNITLASYVHLPINSIKDFSIYAIHFIALQITVFGFTYFFSLHKLFYLILFPIVYLIFSFISFWVFSQDISLTPGVIQAALETKLDIATDTISFPLILYLFWSICCLYFCVSLFKKNSPFYLKSPLLIMALLSIGLFYFGEKMKFGVFKRRLPYNAIKAIKDYTKKPTSNFNTNLPEITSNIDSLQIILVLGETVRADHLQLNGYSRNTTPFLNKTKNILSFPKVYTPLTYTAVSLPQILTDASINHNKAHQPTILYSVLNKLNIQTTWIGNQSLEKSYEKIVNENSNVILIDKFHSVLSFKKAKDEKLLEVFDTISLREESNFTTLHMIGSHWFYDSRYPSSFKQFTPTATSKYLKSSTKEELINSYDNTILYLDWFLHELIKEVKKQNKTSLIIYLSDHGEILGEDNKWLHAQNHTASQNPAMLVWYSNNFAKKFPKAIISLKKKHTQPISTNFLFHSIIDLYKINNLKFNTEESIFRNK